MANRKVTLYVSEIEEIFGSTKRLERFANRMIGSNDIGGLSADMWYEAMSIRVLLEVAMKHQTQRNVRP